MQAARKTQTPVSRLRVMCVALCVLAIGGGMAQDAMAQTASESRPGQVLVGKLEGPEVITDRAKFPQTFSEAPQLAALVKAGKLPPVSGGAAQRDEGGADRRV